MRRKTAVSVRVILCGGFRWRAAAFATKKIILRQVRRIRRDGVDLSVIADAPRPDSGRELSV
jgi:hypothetical protein